MPSRKRNNLLSQSGSLGESTPSNKKSIQAVPLHVESDKLDTRINAHDEKRNKKKNKKLYFYFFIREAILYPQTMSKRLPSVDLHETYCITASLSLRKHAYSNILKILPPKKMKKKKKKKIR